MECNRLYFTLQVLLVACVSFTVPAIVSWEKTKLLRKTILKDLFLYLLFSSLAPYLLQESFSIAAQFRTKLWQGCRSTTSSDTTNNKDLRAKPCHSKEPTVL